MRINILGIPYEVVEMECISRTESLLGQIDYINQRIYLQSGLPKEKKAEVLIHEIFHGVLEATGYDEVLDEKAVQVLSRSLYSLFCDNPIFSLKVFEKEQSLPQS